MGVTCPIRCRVCRGTGHLELEDDHTALYEWLEGYLDPETDEEWLEDQLNRRLVKP